MRVFCARAFDAHAHSRRRVRLAFRCLFKHACSSVPHTAHTHAHPKLVRYLTLFKSRRVPKGSARGGGGCYIVALAAVVVALLMVFAPEFGTRGHDAMHCRRARAASARSHMCMCV